MANNLFPLRIGCPLPQAAQRPSEGAADASPEGTAQRPSEGAAAASPEGTATAQPHAFAAPARALETVRELSRAPSSQPRRQATMARRLKGVMPRARK